MTVDLAGWLRAGVVSRLDVQAASTWARIAGESREVVVLAAALASRAVAAGHVCFDPHRIEDLAPDEGEGAAADRPPARPDPEAWRAALGDSPLVHTAADAAAAAPEAVRPLVVDRAGRVYLRRYWDLQTRLAEGLRARIAADGRPEVDAAALAAGLDRLFPEARDAGPDLQRAAAAGAVGARFFVISGGPGTGKTSTVVKILALLIEQALARGEAPPRIRLLAPTGKAAAHLAATVGRRAETLPVAAEVRAAIPGSAATLHRALGAGGTPTRYRHDRDDPIEADVVIVDEASMVDLALMARLVDALPGAARLILLGDRDQLASVEAGAVLGDIAGSGAPAPAAAGDRAGAATSEAPDVSAAAAGGERPVVHLRRSHRFDAAGDLGALVAAIHAGDADAALALLEDPARPAVRRIEPDDVDALQAVLTEGYAPFARAEAPMARLEALDRFRVLCAHRRGPFGVDVHNRRVERWLGDEGVIAPAGRPWYEGRPVGITRNDHAARLYNGDVGLVVPAAAAGADAASGGPLRVLFRGPDGAPRWLSPRRLVAVETVFATSVHKSQGSEFDGVLVVLPDRPSPIVTRELLYTAVSRARERVCLRAGRDAVRDALARRVERTSGLADAIWGGASG